MFGLPLIDVFVIVGYFLVMILIGLWAMRRIKSQEDYFLGGRRFGKLIQIFATFGSGTSVDTVVGVTTTTFRNGAAGIWVSLMGLFTTPIYWLTSPWYRRLRLITLGDFFEERYNSRLLGGFYGILASIFLMSVLAIGFTGMTKTVLAMVPKAETELTEAERAEYRKAVELQQLEEAGSDKLGEGQKARMEQLRLQKPRKVFSHINETMLIWGVGIIVLIYTAAGGLEAAFYIDLLQGSCLIILSVLCLPFGLAKVNEVYGGSGVGEALRTIHARLPESFFEMFGSPTLIDFTWYYIAAISIMATLCVAVQPNQMVISGSAKDELAARTGFTVGNYIKRLCTVMWGAFGLIAVALYYRSVTDSDLVWGIATRDLLGSVGIGLVGLMMACLMAALMASANSYMIVSSSLLTRNVYRPLLSGRSERHYVFVGRLLGSTVIIGGALIATQFDGLLQVIKFVWEFNVMLAASFWLGMKWRRANRPAAWCSILTTMTLFFILPALLPALLPGLRTDRYLVKTTAPAPMTRTYTAHAWDVQAREREITEWDRQLAEGRAGGVRPKPLAVGERFETVHVLPQKSIFWTKGLKVDPRGQTFGSGMLSLELVALDKLGFDLARNPYALNETIRVLVRTFFPFLVLAVVAFVTRPEDKARLDRFYVRMKTRVVPDRARDAQEVALSNADPRRFDHQRLFPSSQWEWDKWDREDAVGFGLAILVLFGILGLLYGVLSVGA
jgi:solute:Na+ symporter, SSS family